MVQPGNGLVIYSFFTHVANNDSIVIYCHLIVLLKLRLATLMLQRAGYLWSTSLRAPGVNILTLRTCYTSVMYIIFKKPTHTVQ